MFGNIFKTCKLNENVQPPYYSNPPILNDYYNVHPSIIPTPPIVRDSRVKKNSFTKSSRKGDSYLFLATTKCVISPQNI